MEYDKIGKPGMLTYEGEEPVQVFVPRVVMEPSPRLGLIGRIKDKVFGPIMKPHVVLDKERQERLREFLTKVSDCGATAAEIELTNEKLITLARGLQQSPNS